MVGFLRFLAASIILGIVRVITHDTSKPTARDLRTIALSGLLGITLYFAAENIGVQYTTAANASLIVASFPALTALLEFAIYKIKPDSKKIVGIILAFIGVTVITISQHSQATPGLLLGNLLLIVAGIIWAFYNFQTRTVAKKYSTLTLSFYQMTFGTLFFIPLVILEDGNIGTFTASSVLAMIYLFLGCSVAAFLLYNFGLRKLSASTAVSLMNLVPVFGLLFSFLILHETITMQQIIGGVIVIVGVALSSHQRQ